MPDTSKWTQADVDRHNARVNLTGKGVRQTLSTTDNAPAPKRRSKMNNTPTWRHDVLFDSSAEADRHDELLLLQRGEHIRKLRRQVNFPCNVVTPFFPHIECIGDWKADWTYEEKQRGSDVWESIAEDFKGHQTDLFRWKRKHVEAQYGLTIRLTSK